MAKFIRNALRNIIVITLAVIILALILKKSQTARELMAPPGMRDLPGTKRP